MFDQFDNPINYLNDKKYNFVADPLVVEILFI